MERVLEIRKEFPDLKSIAMSGGTRSGTVDYLEVAEKLGATDTLSKPFHQQRLGRLKAACHAPHWDTLRPLDSGA